MRAKNEGDKNEEKKQEDDEEQSVPAYESEYLAYGSNYSEYKEYKTYNTARVRKPIVRDQTV